MANFLDDALVARHGWSALLALLQAKGVITEQEAQAVISRAHAGAEMALKAPECPPSAIPTGFQTRVS